MKLLNARGLCQLAVCGEAPDREGWLQKRGDLNKGFQRRWFVLRGNLLFYYERRGDREPVGVVVLEGCTVEAADAEPQDSYVFRIVFRGGQHLRTYVLSADNQQGMEDWMRALASAPYDHLKVLVASLDNQLREMKAWDHAHLVQQADRESRLLERAYSRERSTEQPHGRGRRTKQPHGSDLSGVSEVSDLLTGSWTLPTDHKTGDLMGASSGQHSNHGSWGNADLLMGSGGFTTNHGNIDFLVGSGGHPTNHASVNTGDRLVDPYDVERLVSIEGDMSSLSVSLPANVSTWQRLGLTNFHEMHDEVRREIREFNAPPDTLDLI